MKFLVLLILFVQELPDALIPYQQEHQLILIFSENNRSSVYEKALLEMVTDPLAIDQRDILIFEIFTKGGINPMGVALSDQDVRQLREYFQVDRESFSMILVDRESREIFRSDKPLQVQEIITRFDRNEDE